MLKYGLAVTNIKCDLITLIVAEKCCDAFLMGEEIINSQDIIDVIGPELTKAKVTSCMTNLERFGFLEFTKSKDEFAIRRGEKFALIMDGCKVEVKDRPTPVIKKEVVSLEDRHFYFMNECVRQNDLREKKLPINEIGKFIEHWTEPNKQGQMKFEKEPFWDLTKRMNTWYRNGVKYGSIIEVTLNT